MKIDWHSSIKGIITMLVLPTASVRFSTSFDLAGTHLILSEDKGNHKTLADQTKNTFKWYELDENWLRFPGLRDHEQNYLANPLKSPQVSIFVRHLNWQVLIR